MTEIIDFGDNYLPHILIKDILFLKQKHSQSCSKYLDAYLKRDNLKINCY